MTNKQKRRLLIWLLIGFSAALFPALATVYVLPAGFLKADVRPAQVQKAGFGTNVTRIYGTTYRETAVKISQMVYNGAIKGSKPQAVILVPEKSWQNAVLAAQLIPAVSGAPVLYIQDNEIPRETLAELIRLNPSGIVRDGRKKVLLLGKAGAGVLNVLKKHGIKYRMFTGASPAEMAEEIDNYKALVCGAYSGALLVVNADDAPEYGLIAAFWNAFRGDSLAFVHNKGIPAATRRMMRHRMHSYAYLFGPEEVVSRKIADELSKLGHVQRIPGADFYACAVRFACYRDTGRSYGWLWGKSTRDFGWSITEPGHNFVLAGAGDWRYTAPGCLLAYTGKHGALLFTYPHELPEPVEDYLASIRPLYISVREQIRNYAWILGNTDSISAALQEKIDRLLEANR